MRDLKGELLKAVNDLSSIYNIMNTFTLTGYIQQNNNVKSMDIMKGVIEYLTNLSNEIEVKPAVSKTEKDE